MYDVELPTARDCMTTKILSLSPEDDIFDAMAQLLNYHFAGAPVVDEDGRGSGDPDRKGLPADRVELRLRRRSRRRQQGQRLPVAAQTGLPSLKWISFGVVDRFLSTNFPLLPVVENEKLVGVISRRDALRGIRELRRRLDTERETMETAAGHQADRPNGIENMQRSFASRSKDQMARLMGRKH